VVVAVMAAAVLATPAAAQTETLVEVFIGLGANLGDAQATVKAAIAQIAALPQTRLLRQSALYKSAPVDAGGDDYINAVVAISTALAPLDLLHALQNLEQQAGRQRPYRNAPRTLDIDILLYGDLRLESPELTVPHPRMGQRAFVLLPLAEIAPDRVKASALEKVQAQRVIRL
jgi:2-amino-4-hydroxy-6-hydroxymethyldihydropteridine diphosphokinase